MLNNCVFEIYKNTIIVKVRNCLNLYQLHVPFLQTFSQCKHVLGIGIYELCSSSIYSQTSYIKSNKLNKIITNIYIYKQHKDKPHKNRAAPVLTFLNSMCQTL